MDKWPTDTMESGYDHVPKAFRDEAEPEAADVDVDEALALQRGSVVLMIAEVVQNADIVGQEGDSTVYLLHLGPEGAGVMAALAVDLATIRKEVAAASELDEGLDAGEFEDEPC